MPSQRKGKHKTIRSSHDKTRQDKIRWKASFASSFDSDYMSAVMKFGLNLFFLPLLLFDRVGDPFGL